MMKFVDVLNVSKYGSPALQIKRLEKKLKKVEAEFEIAKPLRQVRLLKTGKKITDRLEFLRSA